jgi:hypothetical protein
MIASSRSIRMFTPVMLGAQTREPVAAMAKGRGSS